MIPVLIAFLFTASDPIFFKECKPLMATIYTNQNNSFSGSTTIKAGEILWAMVYVVEPPTLDLAYWAGRGREED